MSRINPFAGAFVPQGSQQANIGPPNMNDISANIIQYLETQIDGLRGAVVDELCSLRRDVDILRTGGWAVKVGPFERTKALDDAEVAAMHQQIAARLSLNTTPQNESLYLDGASKDAVKHDSPMKAAPTSKPMILAVKDLTTSLSPVTEGLSTSLSPVAKGFAMSLATQVPSATKASATSLVTKLPVHTQEAAATTENWKPAFIRSIKPLENLQLPCPASMKTFSRDFINNAFQGMEHSPSLFYIPQAIEQPLLPERTYYLMESTVEPFLPASPGQHGAKLTPFFNYANPEGNGSVAYENVPLFIASSKYLGEGKAKANEYIYFGNYSQTRWSDKLDADRIRDSVPLKVKQYWASTLADPARASWMTEALMKHLFAPPEYTGALPKNTIDAEGNNRVDKQVEDDVLEYVIEMKAWKEIAKQEVASMTKEHIMAAFDAPDADQPPGLRLWWEYLQCTHWDEGFYNMLVKSQVLFKNGGRHS